MRIVGILVGCLGLLLLPLRAAEWQWVVPVTDVIAGETKDHPQAFLWIPPTCPQVRAVVVGQHNMLEEGILEHPAMRQTLAELGIAEVWITPALDTPFDFTAGTAEHLVATLQRLAEVSGYRELADAPLVPLGHSALATYPWNCAAWNPGRTLAVLSIHGDAPQTTLTGYGRPNIPWGERTIDGVPGLMVMGEYEWWEDRLTPALAYRAAHPQAPVAVLCDAGHGHFDFSDELVAYLGLFIRKAAAARLPATSPATGPVSLTPVRPADGWLMDRWHPDAPPVAPPAPAARYTGDAATALWAFDEEMARVTEAYYARARGKLPQCVGIAVDGQPVVQNPKSMAGVNLRLPPLGDDYTIHLSGCFLDTVPPGNPTKWTGLAEGAAIGHATGGGPVVLSRICGPLRQTGPDTFVLDFYRMGLNNPKRTGGGWLLASHPGDERYKSAVQQAALTVPLTLKEGAPQQLTFPALADQPVGTRVLKLAAVSDAGAPVHYYVVAGPAEVVGDELRFTPVPPRAKLPLAVTVVAWQWGRTAAPKLQSAAPLTQTFHLVPPAP